MEFDYKKEIPDESKRLIEANRNMEKNPNIIPAILERKKGDSIELIDKTKFLVPKTMTLTQFSSSIRKRINLDKAKALAIFVNGKDKKQYAESGDKLMSELYEKHKDNDGFLYMIYTGEITWGSV